MSEATTWCVQTISGRYMLVSYSGYAPVSVYENGWLVHLRTRHFAFDMPECPHCGDAGEPRWEVRPEYPTDSTTYCRVPLSLYRDRLAVA